MRNFCINVTTSQKSILAAAALAAAFATTLPDNAHARWGSNGCLTVALAGGTGVSPSLKNAKRNARIKWRNSARRLSGANSSAANWDLALDKRYSCRKKLGTHRCTARARPCLGYEVQG